MGIAQKLAREFSDAVRSRGHSYFAKNRVAITAASPTEVVAKVKGTVKYRVRLRLRGTKLLASCTCPYFAPTGIPCKHLWATVMAVDARSLLPVSPVKPLRLITDAAARQAKAAAQAQAMGQPYIPPDMDMPPPDDFPHLPPPAPGNELIPPPYPQRPAGPAARQYPSQVPGGPPRDRPPGDRDRRDRPARDQGPPRDRPRDRDAYARGPGQQGPPRPANNYGQGGYGPGNGGYGPNTGGFGGYGPNSGYGPGPGPGPGPGNGGYGQGGGYGPGPGNGPGPGPGPGYGGYGQGGYGPGNGGYGPGGGYGSGPGPGPGPGPGGYGPGYGPGPGPGPGGPGPRDRDRDRGRNNNINNANNKNNDRRKNRGVNGLDNANGPRGYGQGYGPNNGGPGYGPNNGGPGYGQGYGPNNGGPGVAGVPGALPGPNAGYNGYSAAQARAAAKAQALAARQAKAAKAAAAAARNAKRLLAYVLDVPATLSTQQAVVDLARRARRPNGDWGPLKPWWHTPSLPTVRYDPDDRDFLAELVQAQSPPNEKSGHQSEVAGTRRFFLHAEKQGEIVEKLAKSGRLRLRRADGEDDPPLARWDDGDAWKLGIDVRSDPSGKRWTWRGVLRRNVGQENADRMDLAEPLAILPGLVIQGVGKIAKFDDVGLGSWLTEIRRDKEIAFTDTASQDTLLEKLLPQATVPLQELLDANEFKVIQEPPQPCLILRTPRQNWGTDKLIGELGFDYGGAYVPIARPGTIAVRTDLSLVAHRDIAHEQAAAIQLFELGFRESKDHLLDPGSLEIPAKRVPQISRELVLAGWKVEAEGKVIRPAAEFKLSVTTGIDWFELGGQVAFGDQEVPLPDLLAAARRGETMVALGDGSMGMLPEEWLKRYGMLVDLATTSDDGQIRFGKAQAALLDSLLASQPETKVDIGFGKIRQALPKFEGVVPKEAPAGFHGELRPYQKEGLGWLDYLQKFEFGGILADDMGLGKTVQVLAMLQNRRARRLSKGPSLIVVPRSLVFNWIAEAERFTPRLRVLDYTGPNRQPLREEFQHYDLIVTTYGVLRTDIVELTGWLFDYVILDEAQAIKNSDSQAAKAARLLRGRHRLAMTGTPIENHMGELWSIFEFLNPGMLGTAGVFKKYATGATAADDGARALLGRALRPFILRRTKQQVVKDLPDKVEQTLICDMEPAQRQIYEDLRAHYRNALLRKESKDIAKSRIEVLEALLRLRQAACHPGLIDAERSGDPSAKLDMLIPTLVEVAEEGHKVLVFSQFTSFLGLVKERLDAEGITYEYLDGRTRNRAERVERFQNDPAIPVFLISLKAGGLGLNLTAAEYVYLLDPWWNPAVEAQAIDRSHRIGQTQQVFAYRLICRDTVEQKILELQQKKRDLADAILNADNRLIANLTKDDLEFLLS